MTAEQIIVNAELQHIPKGGLNQSLLRMAYNASRLRSLGSKATKKQTASEVLIQCIELVRQRDPDATFTFNKNFFRIK